MAKSSSQGFYGEDQTHNNHNQMMMNNSSSGRGLLPFCSTSSASSSSSSSSSPSSQLRKILVPLNFNLYQNHHQLGTRLEPRQAPPEDIRCYAGEFARPNLMEASPAALNNGDDEAVDAAVAASTDDYNDVNREDSPPDGLGLGLGGGGGGGGSATGSCVDMVVEREHMFDKVVTPSDVGKLNRLVIPKQHAEKYFPLDSSTNEKGLLLNFEDRNGKPWRFRYSYWNSSQSYVMTKGWSRFVKEKKLDAGDIVSFQRGVGEMGKDRLFIDWRRRPDAPDLPPSYPTLSHLPHHYFSFHRSTHLHPHPWTSPGPPLFWQHQASRNHSHAIQQYPNATNYQPHSSSYCYNYYGGNSTGPYGYNNTPSSSSVIYVRSGGGGGAPQQAAGMVQVQSGGRSSGVGLEPNPVVFESVPVVHGKAAAKRLRLFGVNMDCPITESDECDVLSSSTVSQSHPPPPTTMAPHHPLQLRLYNGSPPIQSDLFAKGKASSRETNWSTGEEM